MCINREQYLKGLMDQLFEVDKWQAITLTRAWAATFPSEAGVYAMKDGLELVYVGETGNLKGRMNDLLDTRHHIIRRTIGKNFFSHHEGFVPASTKSKFPQNFEEMVESHIKNNLRLTYLVVNLGRKELEEFIEPLIQLECKLNKRGKRKPR